MSPLFTLTSCTGVLRRDGSPFIPYAMQRPVRYDGWRGKDWDEDGLRVLLESLRLEDKALLKLIADAGGAMPAGPTNSSVAHAPCEERRPLRALKSHINRQCKR